MQENIEHDMVSVILTGGEAKRMRPLSIVQSKAMLSFLGRPLLAYLLHDLANTGISRAIITDPGRNNDIKLHFGDGSDINIHLDYLPKSPWIGTAGTVNSILENMPDAISSPFIVIYGDSLLQMDYNALIDLHCRTNSSFTIACHRPHFDKFLFENEVPDQPRTGFGIMDLQPDGRVIHFEEKPYLHKIESNFIHPVANAAVYVIDPNALLDVPVQGLGELDFGYDLIPWLLARGYRIFGMDIAPGFRVDLGTLPHYLSVQLAALRGEIMVHADFPSLPDGLWIEDGASIHPGAKLIPPVFIGAGGKVENETTIASAIIGARVIIRERALVRESVV